MPASLPAISPTAHLSNPINGPGVPLNVFEILCLAPDLFPPGSNFEENIIFKVGPEHEAFFAQFLCSPSVLLDLLKDQEAALSPGETVLIRSNDPERKGTPVHWSVIVALLYGALHQEGPHKELLRTDGRASVISTSLDSDKGPIPFSVSYQAGRRPRWFLARLGPDAKIIKDAQYFHVVHGG